MDSWNPHLASLTNRFLSRTKYKPLSKSQEIQQDLQSDGLEFFNDVWIADESCSKYEWISVPNVTRNPSNDTDYYYVIAKKKKKGKMQHIPAHKILSKQQSYKQHIKGLKYSTTNRVYRKHISSVLKVTKRYLHRKRLRKEMKKREKAGEQRAYRRDMGQKLFILGFRIRNALQKSGFLRDKYVTIDVNQYMMDEYGWKFLTRCQDDIALFSKVLGGIVVNNEYGKYEALNLVPRWNKGKLYLRISYDIKYTDKTGVPHFERMPKQSFFLNNNFICRVSVVYIDCHYFA